MPSLFKRLNKKPVFWLVMSVMPLVLSFGCKKKDRLSSSTFNLIVSPPAATVAKTDSITLTARGASAGGAVPVSPTWSVAGADPSTLNTTIGPAVTFTPQALGDVVVSATFDGIIATSHLAVVTYVPSANTFDVYTDELPVESGILADIFVPPGNSVSFDIEEKDSGYTPQGTKYQRATGFITNDAWGVTLDKNNVGLKKDLFSFSTTGSLKFAIRLGRDVTGDNLAVELTDAANVRSAFTLVDFSNGFRANSLDWQEISIPLSSFPVGVNFAQIKVPFAIKGDLISGAPLSFDVDAVRWEK